MTLPRAERLWLMEPWATQLTTATAASCAHVKADSIDAAIAALDSAAPAVIDGWIKFVTQYWWKDNDPSLTFDDFGGSQQNRGFRPNQADRDEDAYMQAFGDERSYNPVEVYEHNFYYILQIHILYPHRQYLILD